MYKNALRRAKTVDLRESRIHLVYSRDWTHDKAMKMQPTVEGSVDPLRRKPAMGSRAVGAAAAAPLVRAGHAMLHWMRAM